MVPSDQEKTVSMSLSFVIWAQTSFTGENFIMSGKTIGSFRRNVLGPLKRMLMGRGYSYEDKRSENLLELAKMESQTTTTYLVAKTKHRRTSFRVLQLQVLFLMKSD